MYPGCRVSQSSLQGRCGGFHRLLGYHLHPLSPLSLQDHCLHCHKGPGLLLAGAPLVQLGSPPRATPLVPDPPRALQPEDLFRHQHASKDGT